MPYTYQSFQEKLKSTPEAPTEIKGEFFLKPLLFRSLIETNLAEIKGIASSPDNNIFKSDTGIGLLRTTAFLAHHAAIATRLLFHEDQVQVEKQLCDTFLWLAAKGANSSDLAVANVVDADSVIHRPTRLSEMNTDALPKAVAGLRRMKMMRGPHEVIIPTDERDLRRLTAALIRPYGIEDVPVTLLKREDPNLNGFVTAGGAVSLFRQPDRLPEAMKLYNLVETAAHEARHVVQLGILAVAVKKSSLVSAIGPYAELMATAEVPHHLTTAWSQSELHRVVLGHLAASTDLIAQSYGNYSRYPSLWVEKDSNEFAAAIMKGLGWPHPGNRIPQNSQRKRNQVLFS